jgi:hypothetical protein
MIHLALWLASFLFICWVAIQAIQVVAFLGFLFWRQALIGLMGLVGILLLGLLVATAPRTAPKHGISSMSTSLQY